MDTGTSGHRIGLPPRQGLYDPWFEHEACGVGFVVNIKGQKSHEIIHQALPVLVNLDPSRCLRMRGEYRATGPASCSRCPTLSCRSLRRAGFRLPGPAIWRRDGFPAAGRAQRRVRADPLKRSSPPRATLPGLAHRPHQRCRPGRTARAAEPVIRQVFIGRGPSCRRNGL